MYLLAKAKAAEQQTLKILLKRAQDTAGDVVEALEKRPEFRASPAMTEMQAVVRTLNWVRAWTHVKEGGEW